MSFKATFIGAGSIGFTRGLVRDLLAVPEFKDIELVFMDINPSNLDMVTKLVQRDIDSNGLSIKIKATTDRREALAGARYIFNVVRIGGLEAQDNGRWGNCPRSRAFRSIGSMLSSAPGCSAIR